MLPLKEVIRYMESGQNFDIAFVKANEATGEAGEIVHGKQCRCTGPISRKNRTINILFPDDQYRKAHLKLITHFNNQIVI